MKKNLYIFLSCICFSLAYPVFAQTSLLQSGPMVGYSEMLEVMLWVQTTKSASVQIIYFDKTKPAEKFKTNLVQTQKKEGYTAHLLADQVLPSKKYFYELYIDGKKTERPYPLEFQTQVLWQYRTDPPNFKFATGSCAYINEKEFDRPTAYGAGYEIFTNIAKEKPDFMLWLGDNVYFREPDWFSWTGMLHRYTHSRSTPEMQALLGSVHQYAIWDDHDYGPNDSDRSYWAKDMASDVFKLFWANPNYGVGGTGGCTGTFAWADCEFFLMDDRYYRSPNDSKTDKNDYFGEKQIKWLVDALTSSSATFKFVAVGGQVLSPALKYENYANYGVERSKLLEAIKANHISGVIFLSGDRHHTELTQLGNLYDLTVSPLTSGPANTPDNENPIQVKGTLVRERNFATLEISGTLKERKLNIRVFNTQGKELWTKDILAKDLQAKP
jgi:alkaline phosphatase D